MADRDEKRPADGPKPGPVKPASASAPSKSSSKSARPAAPDVNRPRSSSARPGRPDRKSTASRPVERPAPPVIAETTVVALPPPKPRPPSPFASRTFRQTLLPPALVTGVGLATIGSAYFLAPADAASRQWSPAAAVAVIAVGGLCVGVAGLLVLSLRRG